MNANRGADTHIVDELIEERAVKLRRSPLWPLYRAVLYPALGYGPAVKMADAVAGLSGRGVLDHVSATLALDVAVSGAAHVPATGPVIIASTHPTGIADGVAMFDALKEIRADLAFFANRDAVRVAPRLDEVLVPVEWVAAKRTRARSRETLESASAAFKEQRCVVFFPSGRIAWNDKSGALHEQPWLSSVVTFARKYDCPIVPAQTIARNSWLYYWFWKINTELRDITLFHELLNKKHKRFEIRFGAAIAPGDLPEDAVEAAQALRRHADEDLAAGRSWPGGGPGAVATAARDPS